MRDACDVQYSLYCANERIEVMESINAELLSALEKLTNEVSCWREGDMAEIGGWTNTYAVLCRIAEARAAIAKAKETP